MPMVLNAVIVNAIAAPVAHSTAEPELRVSYMSATLISCPAIIKAIISHNILLRPFVL